MNANSPYSFSKSFPTPVFSFYQMQTCNSRITGMTMLRESTDESRHKVHHVCKTTGCRTISKMRTSPIIPTRIEYKITTHGFFPTTHYHQ